jgi:catechol 2,3-dioxygenase-like lactoylglutathione lyase family enzyme
MTARGLDHLVIGVRDLDRAGALYERLGFQVGRRNMHPWGTENRIVQFDGAFLELLAIGEGKQMPPHKPGHFSFGAFMDASIKRRQGIAMCVLESRDAQADLAAFHDTGVSSFETFFFERKGVKPDGSSMRVAFTLAFARDDMAPECGFFTCQQHEPQNFWNAAAQKHPNGVTGLAAVLMVAENPSDHHIFLSSFTGERSLKSNSMGITASLPRGRFDILTPQAASAMLGAPALLKVAKPRFVGLAVTVRDMSNLRAKLQANGVRHHEIAGRVIVPASSALGTAIAFEAPITAV